MAKKHKNHSNIIHVDFQTHNRTSKPVTQTQPKRLLKNRQMIQKRGAVISKAVLKDHIDSKNLIDLTSKIKEEKRKTRRIVISGLMDTAIVANGALIPHVSLHDISETGISFDLPLNFSEAFKVKEKLIMRVYLNPEDYFDFDISVTKNIRDIPEEGVCRYGSKFELNDNENKKKAINNLIHFIESVSNILHKDKGEILLYK